MKKTDYDYMCDTVKAWLSTEPKTQAELEALTGIDRRTIRVAIRELRMQGVKVCSGNRGFWIWNGEDESWKKTKRAIIRKAASAFKLIHAINDLEYHEGQLTIEEVDAQLKEVSA